MVMLGMSVLGHALDTKSPSFAKTIGHILGGLYKQELLAVSFYKLKGELPSSDSDLESAEAVSGYERLIASLQSLIHGAIVSERLKRVEREALEFQALRHKLSNSNKPHAEGTVSELAAKLGIIKSEVRRQKQDGTLVSYLKNIS